MVRCRWSEKALSPTSDETAIRSGLEPQLDRRAIPSLGTNRASGAVCQAGAAGSFHLLQQLPRFTQQRPNLLPLGDRIPCEQAMPARVVVSLWRSGARRTAVHAAAPFAAHRRRAARPAGADFGAATLARQHRAAIGGVIAQACAPRPASPSETITLACWVTLPTMALPPSRTDTFCTVMAGSPRLR